jgi:hypothetical protein
MVTKPKSLAASTKPHGDDAPTMIGGKVALPSLRTQRGSPPVKYTPELALSVCERVADGETLTEICREDGLPNKATFNRWVIAYPEVGRAYAAARELSAYALEEDALVLARHLTEHPGSAQRVRAFDLLLNQLRWSASRRNPRVFSEKGTIQVTVPIQINTSLDMGGPGAEGTPEFPNIFDIKATVVTEPDEPMEEVDSATRIERMGNTDLPPMLGPDVPDREVKIKTRAEIRRDHFKKHGARGGKAGATASKVRRGEES